MPEGDTVWQTARRLHTALAGKVLTRSDLRVPKYATADLTGRTVLDVTPRGKHLLTRIEGGLTLHSHLRMDGTWRVYAHGQRWSGGGPAHQIRVILGNTDRTAVGYRLPVLELLRTTDEPRAVGHLGPDLLGPDWNPEQALANLLTDPTRPLGEALLDQRNLAGIGNIYKSELCFLLGATPWLPIGALPADRAAKLPAIAKKLLEANRDRPVRNTTSTLTNNSPSRTTGPRTADPRPAGIRTTGPNTPDLFVYGRAPRPCLRCGTPIRIADQGDGSRERHTYWCPTCQVGPAPGTAPPRGTQHRTTN
jgi:endonuclease-8